MASFKEIFIINKLFCLIFPIFQFLVSAVISLVKIAGVRWLFFWSLSLVKMEYAYGAKCGYYCYTNKKIDSARARIKYLEEFLAYISYNYIGCSHAEEKNESRSLIVASSLSLVGGHTRIIKYYLENLSDVKLYLSGDIRNGKNKREKKLFVKLVARILDNNSKLANIADITSSDSEDIIRKHLENISLLRPRNIIIFNAGSDIYLLMALLVYKKLEPDVKFIYYHHGDDYLQIFDGYFDIHVDIDYNQEIKCRNIENRKLIRIATEDRKAFSKEKKKSFNVFSFVPFYKINHSSSEDCFASLIELLVIQGCKVFFANNFDHDLLHAHLLEKKISNNNIKIITDCYDLKHFSLGIDVYIDTFPIGGGYTLIEAMSMAVPIVIYDSKHHQVFKDPVLNHFKFNSLDEVKIYITRLKEDKIFHKQESDAAYNIYLKYFGVEKMVKTLSLLIDN